MPYPNDRYGQAYFGTIGADIGVETLVLNAALYAVLSGADPSAIAPFVDVTVGGAAVPYADSISISRGLKAKMGTANIGVICNPAAIPAGIAANAEVKITAGVRLGSVTASQQIFLGNLDNWQEPDNGSIRGSIAAYDGAKRLDDTNSTGTMSGDVRAWLETQCAALDLGTDFAVVQRGLPVTIPSAYTITGYRSLLDAAVAVLSAYKLQYLFFSGANELVLFDPASAETAVPLFDLQRVISGHEVTNTSERYNRIKYSNYVGYAHDFVTYQLTVTPEGTNTISASNVSAQEILKGEYNDTADQTTHGILELDGGVQNNICATVEQLDAYAASVAAESQRRRFRFSTRFNPFIDLGNVISSGGTSYFVAELRHNIGLQSVWTTDLELWEVGT